MSSTTEIRFSDFVRIENIRCPIIARDWAEAIRELVTLLHRNGGGFDLDSTIDRCLRREAASSTVIAPRLALLHVRVDTIDRVLVAVGIAPGGIAFPTKTRGTVEAIILLLSPRTDPDLYLQTLAAVTRDLHAESARERLVQCQTAGEVHEFFLESSGELPPHLLARDVMEKHAVTILETDTLREAIDAMCSQRLMDVTVVDEEGDLRGAVSLEDILRLSLPEHLLWMHDLTPLLRFEPFAELLRQDRDRKVADFMRERVLTVPPDMPAIQVAKLFLTEGERQVRVVDGRRLLGTIELRDFMAMLFWA
ncbi:MAG: PTS sugar transporter subunit IIA [Candidatus Hydrogenedentes bacterium]|nr:PTS sugar transporter subunit IIA [Candidatus Hydrogenedentota bacterium]